MDQAFFRYNVVCSLFAMMPFRNWLYSDSVCYLGLKWDILGFFLLGWSLFWWTTDHCKSLLFWHPWLFKFTLIFLLKASQPYYHYCCMRMGQPWKVLSTHLAILIMFLLRSRKLRHSLPWWLLFLSSSRRRRQQVHLPYGERTQWTIAHHFFWR